MLSKPELSDWLLKYEVLMLWCRTVAPFLSVRLLLTVLLSHGQRVDFQCVEFAAVRLCGALSLSSFMECKARNPHSFAHLLRDIGPKIVVERNCAGLFLCPSEAAQLLHLELAQGFLHFLHICN